jgi:hypothetical protein
VGFRSLRDVLSSVNTGRRRRVSFAALAGTALLLLVTSTAAAQSQVFVTDYERPAAGDSSIDGPHPAGDRVVWAERRYPRMHLRSLAADGEIAEIGSVVDAPQGPNNPLYWDLAVGEGRLAFAQAATECTDDEFCRDFRITSDELHLGPIGGPYALVASCQRGEAGCPTDPHCPKYSGVVLVNGMLSYSEGCGDSRFVTRDLATGEQFTFAGSESARRWTGTGRYLLVLESDEPSPAVYDFVVYDVKTGQELYRVPDQPPYGAVGEDGLVALFDPSSGQLSWADRGEPFPHPIAMVAPTNNVSFMVRRRVIAFVTAIGVGVPRRLTLFSLNGEQVSQADDEPAGDWDFDGRRLAWVSEPCQLGVIRIWDPTDDPPDLADRPCPAAAVRGASSRVGRRGRIFVKARCPVRPALGCSGTMRLVAKARRPSRRRPLGEPSYAVASGDTERLKLELTRKQRRFIRRQRSVNVIAVSRAVQRDGYDTTERRRFRFELAWRRR